MKCVVTWLMLAFAVLSTFGETAHAGGSNQYSLVVLRLAARDLHVSETDLRLVSTKLSQEVASAGLFYTMSQTNMERGLRAQNLDPAEGCATIDCALNAGRALGVQLVIYGTLAKINTGYDIEANLVHIGTGEVVKSNTRAFTGSLSETFAGLRPFARELLGVSDTNGGTAVAPFVYDEPAQDVYEPAIPVPERPAPQTYRDGEGGGSKWLYVGLGVLVAGGVGVGLLLAGSDDDGGTTGPNPDPQFDILPDPPTFP